MQPRWAESHVRRRARVTSESDLELLKWCSRRGEQAPVNSLVAAGIPAIGLSGEDDSLLGAEIIDAE